MNIQKEAYDKWLGQFDLECEALSLKVRHIQNVVGFASDIAKIRNMSEDDVQLAEFIAQHHDDGRFVQWTKYCTFNDKEVVLGDTRPHARLSIVVLFGKRNHEILRFAPDIKPEEARVVKEAIYRHGDLVLDASELTERELIHCQIIRDADMLDNMINVKLNETVRDLMKIQGFSMKVLWASEVTEEVFETFCNHKSINYGIVKTPADWWLTWIAYIYNLSLPESLKVVDSEKCIEKIFARLDKFSNKQTKKYFEQAQQIAENYISNKI